MIRIWWFWNWGGGVEVVAPPAPKSQTIIVETEDYMIEVPMDNRKIAISASPYVATER
jgi:hypothetical protein